MTSLFDPTDPRPLHFLGIGGAGMSALALAARRRGVVVTGCDASDAGFADLRSAGASPVVGHDAAHVAGARAVIVTAAVPATHPELVAALVAGVPVVPRKEALAALVNAGTVVALAGTHGKTTTTVMTTEALRAAGLAPSGLAGGRVAHWGGNALLDGDRLFVVEADEYDQAFLTLQPTVAVINNVEPDHLECYGSVEAMEAAFVTFAARAAHVFVGTADAGSDRVAAALGDRVVRFGLERPDGVRVDAITTDADGTTATVHFPEGGTVALRLRVPGLHNLRNATAALAATRALGGDVAAAAEALAAFTGVGRRFERHGVHQGVTFVDDYAHHPTELVATIAAARQAYPEQRLVAVFQPHLYSRTLEHGVAMGEALAAADVVVVTDVYGAREAPIAGVTGALVADAALARGAVVQYEPRGDRLVGEIIDLLRDGDVLLTMGAGDITRIGPAVRDAMVVP
ncbi:MAG TPA: UDP-N-acetylmuramate--L-alanine ligase [Gemmatimonadales bacterium]|nr:UDP-N-acetylmuramate--L-alanine ligase [Gemmatimonadales bacterium]